MRRRAASGSSAGKRDAGGQAVARGRAGEQRREARDAGEPERDAGEPERAGSVTHAWPLTPPWPYPLPVLFTSPSFLPCPAQAKPSRPRSSFSFSLPVSDFLFTEQSKSEQGMQPQAPRHPSTSTCSFSPSVLLAIIWTWEC
jgi:hypothetical protein